MRPKKTHRLRLPDDWGKLNTLCGWRIGWDWGVGYFMRRAGKKMPVEIEADADPTCVRCLGLLGSVVDSR